MSTDKQDPMTDDDDVVFKVETHDPDRDPSSASEENNKTSTEKVEQSEITQSKYYNQSFDEPYSYSQYDTFYNYSTIKRLYGSPRYK